MEARSPGLLAVHELSAILAGSGEAVVEHGRQSSELGRRQDHNALCQSVFAQRRAAQQSTDER